MAARCSTKASRMGYQRAALARSNRRRYLAYYDVYREPQEAEIIF